MIHNKPNQRIKCLITYPPPHRLTPTHTRADIKSHLEYVGVEFSHSVAKLFHVLSEQLVGVGYPVVEVSHLVESKTTGRRKQCVFLLVYTHVHIHCTVLECA